MDKRDFIKISVLSALGTFMFPSNLSGKSLLGIGVKKKRLKVLMLGGRGFLGSTIVNSFLKEGHKVTLLNRGITNPHLFTDLPLIKCDREKENKVGLLEVKEEIRAEKWDIVIDTWQKSPKAVFNFLEEFKMQIGHFHYISSLAVYDKWNYKGIAEGGPITPLPELPTTMAQDYRYAVRKTFAEQYIHQFPNLNYTIYRCHGIRSHRSVDPNNPNEQPYWPTRFLQGGDILLPDVENHHIQMTDAISLSRFVVSCSETKITGDFNVAYPPLLFKDYIEIINKITNKPNTLHWIPGEFLIKNDVKPYREIAYWSLTEGRYYFSVKKAEANGLKNRFIGEMIQDQISGYRSRYPNEDFVFGGTFDGNVVKLSPEKEKSVIEKWLKE